MSVFLRRYFSIFLLLVFVFPLAEKEMHAFEHHDDTHCTATDKHFHNQEHNCELCDLTITGYDPLSLTKMSYVLRAESFQFTPFAESYHIPSAFCDLPCRAPPVA